MNKEQFINDLKSRLKYLPDTDADRSVDYYSEMIDDCIEGGMSEEDAVKSMGNIEEIAGQILAEHEEPSNNEPAIKSTRKLRAWEVTLLAAGSPVWFPIALALLIVAISVYAVVWAVVCVMYAVFITFAAGALVGIAGGIANLFVPDHALSLMFFGVGAFLAGASPLWLILSNFTAKSTIELGRLLVKLCSLPFKRKGYKA